MFSAPEADFDTGKSPIESGLIASSPPRTRGPRFSLPSPNDFCSVPTTPGENPIDVPEQAVDFGASIKAVSSIPGGGDDDDVEGTFVADVLSPRTPRRPSYAFNLKAGGGQQSWVSRFSAVFTPEIGMQYADAFERHRIDTLKPQEITMKDLKEMEIAIGDRKIVMEIVARVRSVQGGRRLSTQLLPHQALTSPVAPLNNGTLSYTSYHLSSGFRWLDYEGEGITMNSFLEHIESVLTKLELPDIFIELFANNRPLPFATSRRNTRGRLCAAMLLRIPSSQLYNDRYKKIKGATMANMTNRLIFMFLPKGEGEGVLFTYHKEDTSDIPWLEEIKDDWVTVSHLSREAFVGHVLTECSVPTKIVLDAYRKNLESLQDLQVSVYPTAIVQWFNVIARQTQVLKRCLNANCGAVEEFGDSAHIDVHGVLKVLKDLSSNAEELVQNSVDAMALRMGLVDFRSQENMRVFTYISAVTSPLTVLTGWYGMNFGSMPELTWEFGYVTFSAVAGGVAIAMILLMRWLHRDTHTVGEEELERMVQSDTTHEVSVFVHHTRNSVDVWTPPSPRSGTPTARNGTPILNRGTPTL